MHIRRVGPDLLIVLPLVDPIMRDRVVLTTFSWIVTHLIDGVVLGLPVPFLRRRLA